MPAEMRHVFSSNVREIGYDADTNELVVRWIKGRTSVYSEVPANIADQVMNSPSVGSALNEMVKGVYEHRYA
jgi:hypothetical protein